MTVGSAPAKVDRSLDLIVAFAIGRVPKALPRVVFPLSFGLGWEALVVSILEIHERTVFVEIHSTGAQTGTSFLREQLNGQVKQVQNSEGLRVIVILTDSVSQAFVHLKHHSVYLLSNAEAAEQDFDH